MANDLLLIRDGTKLAAAEPVSLDLIASYRHGEVLTATVRRARNGKHHRKWFALLNLVFHSQERYCTFEQFLDAVKIATGHFDLMTLPGPVPVQVVKPRSISFAKLGETGFQQFFDKAVQFIVTEVLPGVDSDELERQVLEMVGT